MHNGRGNGKCEDEILLKVTRCREALQRNETTHVDELASVCAEVFTIPENDLPHHLRFDLARARESLFGNALTADADAEIAEEQLRRALITLSLSERMHFAQALISFCDGFEDR